MDMTEMEKELQLYNEGFAILLSQNKINVWIYDVQKKEIKKMGTTTGFDDDYQSIQNGPWGLIENRMIHPESKKEFIDLFRRFSLGEKNVEAVIRMRGSVNDQGYQWKQVTITSREFKNKEYGFIICSDIYSQEDAEEKYLKEDMLQSIMMENVVAISKVDLTKDQVTFLWSLNQDSEVTNQIKNYEQMFSLGLNAIVNENDKQKYIRIFSYDNIMKAFGRGIKKLSLEYHYRKSNGNISWALAYANLFQDSETKDIMYHSFIRDIDETKKMELTLKEKAEHDPVTGFYNSLTAKAIIEEYIKNYKGKEQSYAFITVTIDNFHYIVENYGKSYSDFIVTCVANVLNTIFGNKIVAGRIAKSEFLVFIENITEKEWIKNKAEEFCKVVYHIFYSKKQTFKVSISMGIAFSDDKETEYDTMLTRSNQAMFASRSKGKNQYSIYSVESDTEDKIDSVCVAKKYLYKSCMMDEIEEMAFLIDEEDYSVIYMNKAAKIKFGIKENEFCGRKCYEIIQGYNEPCLYCKSHIPSKDNYNIWENVNDKLNQRYIVKDRMMTWNGRNVRFEMFFCMRNLEILEMDNSMENLLLASIRILMISESSKTAFNYILESIGDFYHADKTYILDIDTRTNRASVTYEWNKAGIQKKIGEMQNLDIRYFKRWINSMEKGQILMLKNIDDIRQEYPFEYELLKSQNVESIYSVPFGLEKDKIGFISLVNPSAHIGDIVFLNAMSYIIAAEIRKRRMIREEEYNKYHDPLTGLLNRNSYSIYLKDMKLDSISSLGILTANINGLKKLNQNLGHNYGDKLVIDIAKCLQNEFGEDCVYRFSGDEFLVVLQDITFDTFLNKIDNIKNASGKIHKDSLSIGYSWAATDIDINRMIANADDFLRVAKKRHYELIEKRETNYDENELHNLLKTINDNWFSAYLQPKALAENGKIRGAEALIRLIHPVYGIIMPGRFVPYLENENLIRYIDFFVYEEVCKLLEDWKKKGYSLFPISLNFSRSTISEENLIEEMKKISDRYDISRNLLEIEITESIGKIEKEVLSEICGKIVKNGYRLSLDDFGAKYSNISILSLLNLNTLKLDKSLIDDIYSNKKMRIIVNNLVKICDEIGIDIVAEGVETEEQLRILQGLGCKYIQGYLINKAIDIDTFEEKYMQMD